MRRLTEINMAGSGNEMEDAGQREITKQRGTAKQKGIVKQREAAEQMNNMDNRGMVDQSERMDQSRTAEPGGNILELRNLTKHYTGFSLQSVNLELPYGCIMGLIGENGAGKSTTIKAIMGLLHSDDGQVILFGEQNGDSEHGEGCSAAVKEKIGIVLGELNLPATFTGIEICKMMQGIYKKWNSELFYQYLEQYRIDRKKKIKDYSRGMKMKAALAIALSHDARLLLLDEPTSGLDPVAREEVLDLLREFVMDEERSVLISSHIISDLEKTADYVAFLHQGRLLLSEEKDQLLAEFKLLKGSRSEIEKAREDKTIEVFGIKENSFSAAALVKLNGFRPERSGLLVESTSLEDIMIYLIQGERSVKDEGTVI